MSERQKTFIAAAALAAAVGVYVEISYQEKLKDDARLRELRGLGAPTAPSSSGSSSSAPVHTDDSR